MAVGLKKEKILSHSPDVRIQIGEVQRQRLDVPQVGLLDLGQLGVDAPDDVDVGQLPHQLVKVRVDDGPVETIFCRSMVVLFFCV